jgi:hypothetical protein
MPSKKEDSIHATDPAMEGDGRHRLKRISGLTIRDCYSIMSRFHEGVAGSMHRAASQHTDRFWSGLY